jgi:hypothetical protein
MTWLFLEISLDAVSKTNRLSNDKPPEGGNIFIHMYGIHVIG